MDLNLTLIINIVVGLAVVFVILTAMFAKNKTDNLMLVTFYSTLLNLLIPPIGWIYCGFWSLKKVPVEQ